MGFHLALIWGYIFILGLLVNVCLSLFPYMQFWILHVLHCMWEYISYKTLPYEILLKQSFPKKTSRFLLSLTTVISLWALWLVHSQLVLGQLSECQGFQWTRIISGSKDDVISSVNLKACFNYLLDSLCNLCIYDRTSEMTTSPFSSLKEKKIKQTHPRVSIQPY